MITSNSGSFSGSAENQLQAGAAHRDDLAPRAVPLGMLENLLFFISRMDQDSGARSFVAINIQD